MSTTPDRIFSLLEKKGIDQKDFAGLIGASDKTVSAWKTGRAKSYTKYLSKIAEVLETSVDYLLNGNSAIITIDHDLPPQGSFSNLLKSGKDIAVHLFDNVQYFTEGNEDLIKRLNSPTCSIYFKMSFYDCVSDQIEKPILLTKDGLSTSEQSLMDLFRQLTPDQQEMVLRMVQAAADKL